MVFNITECVDFHHGKRIVITILVCGHDVVIIMHKEGDALLIQQPVYYPFREVIEDNGRIFVNNQLHYEDGKYTIDFEDFEKKIVDNNVKVFILCNPHNPVGRVWTKEELEKMGVRIPDDISITGYDNSLYAQRGSGITTIAHPQEKLGEMAAELILEKINGVPEEESKVERLIYPELIIRGSCRKIL